MSSNSNAASNRKKRAFPFTTIIVTNPDEASAQSAQKLLERTLQQHLNGNTTTNIISTCDPFGARCGSFGGSLAAIELVNNNKNGNSNNARVETILCLHAGGDSSRCPLSMILGKAWTHLPSSDFQNPIAWLLHQMEDLYYRANLWPGSLVVTATDCLISFGAEHLAVAEITQHQNCGNSTLDPHTILGVAVPAPLTTAQNHGVFVLPPQDCCGDSSSAAATTIPMETPLKVWQKPSVEQLQNDKRASFEVSSRSGPQAWIDVGIVVFGPKAFQALANLSDGLLSMCTRSGIKAAYQEQASDAVSSLEDFAKTNALKVDLYTDILHNLPLGTSAPSSKDDDESSNNENSIQASLRKVLSNLPLKVLVVPEGSFLHLGTTRELIEFNTTNSNGASSRAIPSIMDQHVTQSLAKALRLNPRFQCLLAPMHDDNNNSNNTTLCSTFPPSAQLGASTLVEYSDLQDYDSITIGDHCMLSGWRKMNLDETSLEIPSGMSVQLLPLANQKDKFVMMALGTTDSIKSSIVNAEIYGVPFADFPFTEISFEDFGFGDGQDHNLWNAKIHPIVNRNDSSFSALFGWVQALREDNRNLRSNPSFCSWRNAEKVSLREIHGISNASQEWAYRLELEQRIWRLTTCQDHIESIVELLRNKSQTVPCDLEFLVKYSESAFASLSALVASLEDLALQEFAQAHYDVSGRALMLASATIADFPHDLIAGGGGDTTVDANGGDSTGYIPTDRMSIVRNIFGISRSALWRPTEESMAICSKKLERLAFNMIETTITTGFQRFLVNDDDNDEDPMDSLSTELKLKRSGEIVRDQYVLSVAPVRVDLAGGWSDTPPITYEFGGSVTGMAVLVDGCFPLSCRCRLVSGKTGVFLRTELRDIASGSLVSAMQDEIQDISDLKDFRDPSASCALLKAALVCLGMVSEEDIQMAFVNLQELINTFCSSPESNVRIEIITTSLLGMGTGMGTSSILGACILQSLATCVGIGKMSDECLIHAVLVLEQLLSSGGGWQDQAHGILPGIKTVTSAPKIPLDIQINPLPLSSEATVALENKLLFAYTGKTRLAKNILQQVLRRWARRTDEIVETVKGLVDHSVAVREALETQSWDKLGEYMYRAYQLKCVMAGEGSGAEPESVKVFVSEMMQRNQIRGAMLCGAGGGGFLLLLLDENADRTSVERTFEDSIAPLNSDFEDFRFHDCTIAQTGLSTTILRDDNEAEKLNAETYKLSWQKPSRLTE